MTTDDTAPVAQGGEREMGSTAGAVSAGTGSGEVSRHTEQERLVATVNRLSDDAIYIASCDWFRRVLAGHPILMAPTNRRQKKAFKELLAVGFVHGDVERGVYGYRSTWTGRDASPICRAALAKAEGR